MGVRPAILRGFERRLIAPAGLRARSCHHSAARPRRHPALHPGRAELDGCSASCPSDQVALLSPPSADIRDAARRPACATRASRSGARRVHRAKARARLPVPGSRRRGGAGAVDQPPQARPCSDPGRIGARARQLRAAHRIAPGAVETQRERRALHNTLLEGESGRRRPERQSAIRPPRSRPTARPAVITALTRPRPGQHYWQPVRALRGRLRLRADGHRRVTGPGSPSSRRDRGPARAAGRDPSAAIWLGDLSRSYTRAGRPELALGDSPACSPATGRGTTSARTCPKTPPRRRTAGRLAWTYSTRPSLHRACYPRARSVRSRPTSSSRAAHRAGRGGPRQLGVPQRAVADRERARLLVAPRDPGAAASCSCAIAGRARCPRRSADND